MRSESAACAGHGSGDRTCARVCKSARRSAAAGARALVVLGVALSATSRAPPPLSDPAELRAAERGEKRERPGEPRASEVRPPAAATAKQARAEFAALAEALEDPRPEKRRAAVHSLGVLATRPAWELVLGALLDRESEVADAAQLELGSLRDATLALELCGPRGLRAKERELALRVAEALGRMAVEQDGLLLAKRAAQAEPEVARTLLWSIERLQRAKLVRGEPQELARELDQLVRSQREPDTCAAALCALGTLDYFLARERVEQALGERDPALRCAALAVAAGYPENEGLALAKRGLADREPRVRCQAIENLAAYATRAAMLALADELEAETCERLRWRVLACLQARSGLDHGFEPAAWRAWAETVSSSAIVTGETRRAGPVGGTRVDFAGLPMLSTRSAFLIDFSGSMWQTKIGERTRKEIIDAHLRGVLQALPQDARFNVIPFTNAPIPWEKALVPANRANVARAIDWFERSRQSGRGNFYDAARLALADPDVDTIVVLTDGVPTGGRHSCLELVVELLCEENRFRKVAFDAVLVDAPGGRRRLWEDLAQRTGGRTVSVGLEELAQRK